jgi:cold shock CspA family protein
MMSSKFSIVGKQGRAATGRIAELSPGRFCGVIRASDGQSVFFHGRDLEGRKYNDVEIGGPVRFELIEDHISGPRAAKVRVSARER